MSRNDLIQQLLEDFNYDKSSAVAAIENFKIEDQKPRAVVENKNPIVISFEDVVKTYKTRSQTLTVLDHVTLNIHEGEFVVVTGPSGSGKSTLLQLMGGLDRVSAGAVKVYSNDLSKLSDSRLSELRGSTIGFVFQFFYLQPFLKLKTNVEVPGMFARSKRLERDTRAKKLLNVVGLNERDNAYPRQLSGGQLQRAAISRALINNPKIILADEPTGNLDTKNSAAIVEIFKELRQLYNVTIVLVTHDKKVADQADRIIEIQDGRIL